MFFYDPEVLKESLLGAVRTTGPGFTIIITEVHQNLEQYHISDADLARERAVVRSRTSNSRATSNQGLEAGQGRAEVDAYITYGC